jgi:hypothetical protein
MNKSNSQSYSCVLRTLTRKSVIGFGKYQDLTVQNVIDTISVSHLIRMYYNLGKISFTEDVLNEIGVFEEIRINKPGKLIKEEAEKKISIALTNYYKDKDILKEKSLQKRRKKANIVDKEMQSRAIDNKLYNKNSLMSKNHNKFNL